VAARVSSVRDLEADPQAEVTALYARTWPRLIGVLVSIGGSRADAEEVAQDAYVKLLSRWDGIRRYDDPEAWVRAVAVRTLVSRLWRQQVASKLLGRTKEVREPDGDALEVAAALARIPPAQRAVVVLHHVMDLSVEQIADELELPPGTVKSRLTRAHQTFASHEDVLAGPELRTGRLIEYVDRRTQEQAPPFGGVEQVVRRRKQRRNLLVLAAVVLVAAGGVVTANLRGAEELAAPDTTGPTTGSTTDPSTGPTVGRVDEGPPPAQFKSGETLLVLEGEIPVTAVMPATGNFLRVEVARDEAVGEACLPHVVARILSQGTTRIRIAVYRYVVGPSQIGAMPECLRPDGLPLRIQLDLGTPLGDRQVVAGSTGNRVVLN
jgi:RNA polymerase sigma factor (sigma-70 family)